jgi:hypothetical protein
VEFEWICPRCKFSWFDASQEFQENRFNDSNVGGGGGGDHMHPHTHSCNHANTHTARTSAYVSFIFRDMTNQLCLNVKSSELRLEVPGFETESPA